MTAASELISIALSGGRRAELRCGSNDLSITAPLRASNGEWEPHLRAFFEHTIQPDWVCFDIGANIGIHTLNLATLATQGRVVAFEADSRNLEWLGENIGRCPEPHGEIEIVPGALWNADGSTSVASFDELTGCSFISGTDVPADSERRIREVLAGSSIDQMALTTRIFEVVFRRLDEWARPQALSRLDFVKIDIEGAEIQAIGGGWETITRFRPMLLTEYNPACGASYYGHAPRAYFDLLRSLYATIRVLQPDGSLSQPLAGWIELEEVLRRLAFVDLVCTT
jgi:FkbM family methyltransferase